MRSIESTEKVQFFKDQNEKCLRFITFLSTNRLNKAMIDRKRRGKTTISPLLTFNLKVGFTFSVLSKYRVPTMQNRFGRLTQPLFKKSFCHQGFFAVKRRAVFILGAMWWALVRGWRRDCVVGGMETRFQWRKAHSRTAKCEAFHIAPRLFFMFLFLITFAIRQHCIIYPRNFPQSR